VRSEGARELELLAEDERVGAGERPLAMDLVRVAERAAPAGFIELSAALACVLQAKGADLAPEPVVEPRDHFDFRFARPSSASVSTWLVCGKSSTVSSASSA
jgi:hypothetical protein